MKEVQLENFKSFGKRIKVPIPRGFTAITGPNGSGKSNLSDAILFVLGPKSPKKVRAARLTDLIFNGGPGGRPASYTKVSLVFDNTDRMMPFNSDEVTLTRLVKISPSDREKYYSHFYVNGKPSTLNEFSNLLANCRISADGYNIVQQGDITNMVNMGAVERRRILDEMAGITKFDDQIDKANRQKEIVDRNTEKLGLILGEIEKNLGELKKDRENAIKYRSLKDELTLSRAHLAFREKYELESQLAKHHRLVEKLLNDKGKMMEKVEELAQRMARDRTKLADVEEEIAERSGEEGRRLKEQIDSIRLKIFEDKAQIETLKDTIKEANQELEFGNRDLKQLNKVLKGLDGQLEKDDAELLKVRQNVGRKKEELEEIETEMSRTSVTLMELQREMSKLVRNHELLVAQRHESDLVTDRLVKQADDLSADLAASEDELKTLEFNLKDAIWEMDELKKGSKEHMVVSTKELSAEFMQKKNRERKLSEEARTLEDAVTRLNRQYQKLKAMKDAREHAKKGYTRSIDAIMDAKARGTIHGIVGTISQLANVSHEYEEALSVAAGARMMAIVVESDQTAAECIRHLKQNNAGRATFLPLNKLMGGHPRGKSLIAARDPAALGFAIELLDFDERYRNAFWYVFQDTVIVRDMNAARKLMGGVRLVTLDGDLTDPQGGMTGGAKSKGHKVAFGKDTSSELENIAGELSQAQSHADRAAEELRTIRAEIDELEVKLRDASGKEGETLKRMEVIKLRMEEFHSKVESTKKIVKGKKAELDKVLARKEDATAETGAIAKKITELENTREELGKKINNATPQKLRRALETLKKDISDLEERRRDLESGLEAARATVETNLSRKEEVERSIVASNTAIRESGSRITEAENRITVSEKELGALRKVEESIQKELKGLFDDRDGLRENITRLQETLKNAKDKLDSYDDLINSQRLGARNVEDTLAEVMGRLQHYESMEISDAEIVELPGSDDLKRKITSCETRIERLGDVNMKALEDFEYQESRKKEIRENMVELEKERQQLEQMVEGLVTNKTEGLMKVLGAVNENFGTIFHEISNGGEGGLKLENPEDPFSGGLIIWARPPGKKVHRIEALSGGEKGLTAMSFIFAMQQYNPSPFYLLDEVDQNLDSVNTEIVARRIRSHCSHAQFIVVTLHKVALKEADHVYGATIQKNGITDLIGVSVSDIEMLPLESNGTSDGGQRSGESREEVQDGASGGKDGTRRPMGAYADSAGELPDAGNTDTMGGRGA